jgi:hypothetical protein
MTIDSIARILVVVALPAAAFGASSDSGWVRVVADPDGSPVYIGGRYVGTSPVDSVRWVAGPAVVQVQQGPRTRWNVDAAVETVDVPSERLIEVRLLAPAPPFLLGPPEPGESPTVMRGPGTLGVRSETWTFVSGAAMVASGVLAAVFRDKANQAASRYLDSRDPAALQDVRRYDRYAGAAMVGVQISLGAFVLFLAGP